MINLGILSQISLTGQDGFDWLISQNVLLVNDWSTSHKYLTLVVSNVFGFVWKHLRLFGL